MYLRSVPDKSQDMFQEFKLMGCNALLVGVGLSPKIHLLVTANHHDIFSHSSHSSWSTEIIGMEKSGDWEPTLRLLRGFDS